MKTNQQPRAAQALAAAALGYCAFSAQAQGTTPPLYSVAKPLQFYPGTAKSTAMLSRIKDLQELVAERYNVAMIDLNDDGRAEIIVQSESGSFCGSGGCMTMVVEQQGNRMVMLLTQNLDSALGITQEKVGGYRALAGLDDKGQVAIANKLGTPLHGKQMVYPMQVANVAAAPAEVSAAPGGRSAGGTGGTGMGRERPDILGMRIGMPAAEVERAYKAQRPGAVIKTRATRYDPVPELTLTYGLWTYEGESAREGMQFKITTPPEKPAVWAMLRGTGFPKGAQPTVAKVIDSLTEKYGPPNQRVQRSQITEFYWLFDAAGTPMPVRDVLATIEPCAALGLKIEGIFHADGQTELQINPSVRLPKVNCPDVVVVKAHVEELGSQGPGLANTLSVEMADFGLAQRAHAATRAMLKQTEEARERARLERGQQIKPKL
jgi:hypothetical protein